MIDSRFHDQLRTKIYESFHCSFEDADLLARTALDLRRQVEKNPEGLEDLEVTIGLVIRKLEQAPDQLDLIEKWNWWVGTLRYIDSQSRYFQI